MDAKHPSEGVSVELVLDATALGKAALSRDFDEARFRAGLIAVKAELAGLDDIAHEALRLSLLLGLPGTCPGQGYGEGLLRLVGAMGVDLGAPDD